VGQRGLNGQGSAWRHRVIERLAAIRLHAGISRRWLRRDPSASSAAVLDQIERIDQNVSEISKLLDEIPSAAT
jgi:hypothetical protein